MRYLGGKARQAKKIKSAILDKTDAREIYIEPFLGGGSVASLLVPEFSISYLSDLSEDLVLFWNAVQSGWCPPAELTKEDYITLKDGEPSALRAWAGFAGSYCGKWFGGYGPTAGERDYLEESLKSTLKKANGLEGAVITSKSYLDVVPTGGNVIYCDPPYADTTGYDATGSFDSDLFWETVYGWSEENHVFISEYTAPEGWEILLLDERFTVVGTTELGQTSKKKQEYLFYRGPS